MAIRALRAPLVLLLALVVGGGVSVACLAADLCGVGADGPLPIAADAATAKPDSAPPEPSCHASRDAEKPATPEPRLTDGGVVECCAIPAQRVDAKTDLRERLTRCLAATGPITASQSFDDPPRPAHAPAGDGARPGLERPAYILHGPLLL